MCPWYTVKAAFGQMQMQFLGKWLHLFILREKSNKMDLFSHLRGSINNLLRSAHGNQLAFSDYYTMKYNGVQSRRQGKAFVGLDPLDELLCPVNVFVSEKKTVCIAYTLVSELLHVIAPPPTSHWL